MEKTIAEGSWFEFLKLYFAATLCLVGFAGVILLENKILSLVYLVAWLIISVLVLRPYYRERRLKYKKKQQELKELKLQKQADLKLERDLKKQEAETASKVNRKDLVNSFSAIVWTILVIGVPVALFIWLLTALIGVFGFVLGILIFLILVFR